MSRATEPSDILWKNMKGERGLFILRRVFLGTFGLIVIFFGTSPTVIVSKMNYFSFDDADVMSHYITPFVIILIN